MKNQHPNFWSTPTGWAALALIVEDEPQNGRNER